MIYKNHHQAAKAALARANKALWCARYAAAEARELSVEDDIIQIQAELTRLRDCLSRSEHAFDQDGPRAA